MIAAGAELDSYAQAATTYEVVAPSNIALVKYWGKRDAGQQLPANDSLSMTLATAHTRTVARRAARMQLAGAAGHDKARRHLARLASELGFDTPLAVATHNSFPSDCGIASSASGLAALTVAAIAAWTEAGSLAELASAGFSTARLADLARRGSGSACRSLFGGYVHWHADNQEVEVAFAADHWALADVIVVLSEAAKPVGSSAAHAAAWSSPLFLPRLAGMPERIAGVRAALAARDLPALGGIIETEALEMHAVMQTATPPARYLLPDSSRLLAWTRDQRRAGRLPAWFTVDAGPNVHLICHACDAPAVAAAVAGEFPDAMLIQDRVGPGPTLRAVPAEVLPERSRVEQVDTAFPS